MKINTFITFGLLAVVAGTLFYLLGEKKERTAELRLKKLPALFDQANRDSQAKIPVSRKISESDNEYKAQAAPLKFDQGSAQKFPKKQIKSANERLQRYQSAVRRGGIVIESFRSKRFLPDDIYAVKENEYDAQLPGDEIERANGYVFLQLSEGQSLPPEGLRTAIDPDSGLISVVTGRLKVKVKSEVAIGEIANEFNLQLSHSFGHLGLAFYEGNRSSSQELVDLLGLVRRDQRIISADLELLGPRRVAN